MDVPSGPVVITDVTVPLEVDVTLIAVVPANQQITRFIRK